MRLLLPLQMSLPPPQLQACCCGACSLSPPRVGTSSYCCRPGYARSEVLSARSFTASATRGSVPQQMAATSELVCGLVGAVLYSGAFVSNLCTPSRPCTCRRSMRARDCHFPRVTSTAGAVLSRWPRRPPQSARRLDTVLTTAAAAARAPTLARQPRRQCARWLHSRWRLLGQRAELGGEEGVKGSLHA